jgi:hypothetical protein
MGEPDSDLALRGATVLAGQRQPFGHRPSRRPMFRSIVNNFCCSGPLAEEYPDVDVGYMPT